MVLPRNPTKEQIIPILKKIQSPGGGEEGREEGGGGGRRGSFKVVLVK